MDSSDTKISEFNDRAKYMYNDVAGAYSVANFLAVKDENDPKVINWEATWAKADFDRNDVINYKTAGTVMAEKFTVKNSISVTEIVGEKLVRMSHNGKMRAIVREIMVKNVKTQFLEIWRDSWRISSTNLTAAGKHGPIYNNASFCCMEWSNNDKKLLYVAEKKKGKSQSFYDPKPDQNVELGGNYVFQEDWGEQLIGCATPIVVIFDVESEGITPLEDALPDDMCVGEALWSKNDQNLIVLGWKIKPFRLGLVYCKNRLSNLYNVNIESLSCCALTDGSMCVYSPRMHPDGNIMVYLENKAFGPHQQCSKMMVMDMETKSTKVLVDVVDNPEEPNRFQGIYTDSLSRGCWYKDKILFSSFHRSSLGILSVDTKTGVVRVLIATEEWQILSICNETVFVSNSAPAHPPLIKYTQVHDNGFLRFHWLNSDGATFYQDVTWQILQHKPTLVNKKYPDLDFESILLQPEGQAKGLVVNPHSGPHMSHTAGFDPYSAALCKLGFAVLRVNFRGSIGFGQNNVNSLPGKLGVQDISDIQQSAKVALITVKTNHVFVYGSSHGGSMTLSLMGKFPEFYSAGVSFNPCSNIASMVGTSDITDWSYCETKQPYSYAADPSQFDFKKAIENSPIKFASTVKAPLLMVVSAGDVRVPQSQSYEFYKLRKAMGGVVKMLVYPDNNHSLAEVHAAADAFLNMARWFHNKGEAPISKA